MVGFGSLDSDVDQETPFVLYTKAGCPWCVDAVAWLEARGYAFREVDVRRDPAKLVELRQISGQTMAPTLVVGDRVLPDFDTRQLERFLRENGLTKG